MAGKCLNQLMIKTLNVNGRHFEIEIDSLDIPLAWVLRDQAGIPIATRCHRQDCEVCLVYINGHPVRSCSTPLFRALNNQITTTVPITPGSSLTENPSSNFM